MPFAKIAVDFDPTQPTQTDRIGSYLIGAGGTVISSTGSFLDVNIASGTGSGIYNEDGAVPDGGAAQAILAQRQDVLAGTVTANNDWGYFKQTTLGELYTFDSSANASLSTIVTKTTSLATLVLAEDATATDGGPGVAIFAERQDVLANDVTANGDLGYFKINNVGRLYTTATVSSDVADNTSSTENPILVGGVGRTTATALTALSASLNKSELLMDLYRRVFINDSFNVAWKAQKITATTTAAQVAATPLGGRTTIQVQNKSGKKIWFKQDNTVLADATSVEVDNNDVWEFKLGEALQLWTIVASGTADFNLVEAA